MMSSRPCRPVRIRRAFARMSTMLTLPASTMCSGTSCRTSAACDDAGPVVGTDALVADADPTATVPPSTAGACRSRSATSRGRTAPPDVAPIADVAGDVRGERRLADARPSGDHDQVARLQPRREVVEIAEPGRQPGVGRVPVLDVLEVDHRLVDQVARGWRPRRRPLAGRRRRCAALRRRPRLRGRMAPRTPCP